MLLVALSSSPSSRSGALDSQILTTEIAPGSGGTIAHIDLEGIIMSVGSGVSMVDEFKALVDRALKDDDVVALVVRIQSPGGGVTASDRLHHIISEADSRKPVIAYLDTIAASGGYYAACGARHIATHPQTLTGSIGVIMQSINYHELLDKVGLEVQVFKSGALKDFLSGSRPSTELEVSHVEALVEESYGRFLEVVAGSRPFSVSELRNMPETDGRIFSGTAAVESRMADSLGFIESAYDVARQEAGAPNASVTRYHLRRGLFGSLGLFAQGEPPKIEINLTPALIPDLTAGVPYYLHLP